MELATMIEIEMQTNISKRAIGPDRRMKCLANLSATIGSNANGWVVRAAVRFNSEPILDRLSLQACAKDQRAFGRISIKREALGGDARALRVAAVQQVFVEIFEDRVRYPVTLRYPEADIISQMVRL
jgi:hypothetical protein